jgi:hypothetical protein
MLINILKELYKAWKSDKVWDDVRRDRGRGENVYKRRLVEPIIEGWVVMKWLSRRAK